MYRFQTSYGGLALLTIEARLVNRVGYGELATITIEQHFNQPLAEAGVTISEIERLASSHKGEVVARQMTLAHDPRKAWMVPLDKEDVVLRAAPEGLVVIFPIQIDKTSVLIEWREIENMARALRSAYNEAPAS